MSEPHLVPQETKMPPPQRLWMTMMEPDQNWKPSLHSHHCNSHTPNQYSKDGCTMYPQELLSHTNALPNGPKMKKCCTTWRTVSSLLPPSNQRNPLSWMIKWKLSPILLIPSLLRRKCKSYVLEFPPKIASPLLSNSPVSWTSRSLTL